MSLNDLIAVKNRSSDYNCMGTAITESPEDKPVLESLPEKQKDSDWHPLGKIINEITLCK